MLNPHVDLVALESEFSREHDDDLRFLADQGHLVDCPDENGPLFDPYLPWVGPDYLPGGVLILATAQNLGQFDNSSPERRRQWRHAVGWPDRTLWRLYPESSGDWRSVPIQPWMDGILAALAGTWMLAQSGDAPEALDEIARRVAVTNFFKHSLRKTGKSGRQGDKNPQSLPGADRRRFVEVTRRNYVDPEVRALKPGAVIGFKTMAALGGFSRFPCPVSTVNDPSWIKQGMGGVAGEDGSWRLRVDQSGNAMTERARQRMAAWVSQLSPAYSGGKREATEIYLNYNFLEWKREETV